MRIAFVSNLYPSHRNPSFGTWAAGRVEALRRLGADVDVIAATGSAAHREVPRRYGGLALRGLTAAVLARLRNRRFDIVEAHIAYPTGMIALPMARLAGARLVLFVHGADILVVPWRNRAHGLMARFVFERADLVIANSRFTAGEVTRRMPVDEGRVSVVSPGIDFELFASRAMPTMRERTGILYVGHLSPEKGVDVLLAAASRLRPQPSQSELLIVGVGPEYERLRVLAETSRIQVRFLGALTPSAVAELMGRSRITVVPSRRESLGLVALEAMAAGSLVVATAVGGLRETVIDNETGFACQPDHVDDLVRAIEAAERVASDDEHSREIRVRAKGMAQRHDRRETTKHTLRLFEDLIAGRSDT